MLAAVTEANAAPTHWAEDAWQETAQSSQKPSRPPVPTRLRGFILFLSVMRSHWGF